MVLRAVLVVYNPCRAEQHPPAAQQREPARQGRARAGAAQVFAPLARLLGLYSLKEELEALAFRYADPDAHAEVQRRLDVLAAQQGAVVLQAQRALQAKLADDAYLRSRAAHVTVEAHQKAVYSVYRRVNFCLFSAMLAVLALCPT